jgi:epsin
MNNPYQQQQQPPLQLEWAQPSFNSNAFSEPSQQQQQQSNPYQQPQQTAQNPYLQANQFNTNGLQAQMTGFVSSPPVIQQQPSMDFFSQQQQQPQHLQAQMTGFPAQQPAFQTSMVTGTNPFSQMAGSQSPQQHQPMQPQQHDYSSLVFGNGAAPAQQQKASSPLFPPARAATTPNFSFNTPVAASAPSPAFASASVNAFGSSSPRIVASPKPQPAPSQNDTKYSKLNALLANKE